MGSFSVKLVKVGICGLGIVGGGIFNVFKCNVEEIVCCVGCGIEVVQIVVCWLNLKCDIGVIFIIVDIFDVVCNFEIDVVVELIGGYILVYELVFKVIENGKYVVIVNKVLIVVYGNEIFVKVCEKGVIVVFEVVVVGGILVIKVICEGLLVNCINWLVGIINGIGNFIFSEMCEKGCIFFDVFVEVQVLGYVEVDLIFDVEGIDVVYKLIIFVLIVFGILLQFDKVYIEGILKLISVDVNYVDVFGYCIKYLGVVCCIESGFELCVYLILIFLDCLIVNVNGVMNVVMVNGDVVGLIFYYGVGVGMELIVFLVVVDFVDVVCVMIFDLENCVLYLVFQLDVLFDYLILLIEVCESVYYLCIQVKDYLGVLVQVVIILFECGINIELIMQKEVEEQDGLVLMILVIYWVIE